MDQEVSPSTRLAEALTHDVRRELLDLLCEHPGRGHDLDNVIDRLVDRVGDARADLELRCYHTHLPKLATVGLIDYDWDAGGIRYVGEIAPERVRHVIDEMRAR